MKVSLKTLINVSKASINNGTQNSDEVKEEPVKCSLVMERDLEEADEIIDASKEFENPYFKSMMYIKYYECSVCKKEFTNQTTALLHENTHNGNSQKQLVDDLEEKRKEGMDKKIKILSIEDIAEEDIKKPIRRFYVPLIRSETVKYIDVENKSVYVDPYTIFIGEDK
uniref:C2H2-type domain-containing protein n=1 Tax=Theileria annulata TaxID=5874 RepID=A0A3B0MZU9_THEAN